MIHSAEGLFNKAAPNDSLLPNFAANQDVLGPIPATQVSSDPDLVSLNYIVQFQCEEGTWTQTHGQGNCEPTPAACGTDQGQTLNGPPDTSNPLELCAAGSVYNNDLTASSSTGPWTWSCNGTPGEPSKTCNTAGSTDFCGSASGQATASTPTANLCAPGMTASTVTESPPDTVAGTNYATPLYQWTCTNSGGGSSGSTATTQSCSAPGSGACADGTGYVDGTYQSQQPTAATTALCFYGQPSAIVYSRNVLAIGNSNGWNWTCTNPNDGLYEACTVIDSNAANAYCGAANPIAVSSNTVPPAADLLCNYTNSTLASGPTFVAASSEWIWTCQADNGGPLDSCYAPYDPTPGVCGPANNETFPAAPPTDLSQLCSGGTLGVKPYQDPTFLYYTPTPSEPENL